jgi:hypothetical protein
LPIRHAIASKPTPVGIAHAFNALPKSRHSEAQSLADVRRVRLDLDVLTMAAAVGISIIPALVIGGLMYWISQSKQPSDAP